MNIARRFRSLAVFLCGKDEKRVEEQCFYFSLPYRPLPPGFSHTDLGCGSRKAKATLLGYSDRQADIGIDITIEGTQADLVCKLGLEEIALGEQ